MLLDGALCPWTPPEYRFHGHTHPVRSVVTCFRVPALRQPQQHRAVPPHTFPWRHRERPLAPHLSDARKDWHGVMKPRVLYKDVSLPSRRKTLVQEVWRTTPAQQNPHHSLCLMLFVPPSSNSLKNLQYTLHPLGWYLKNRIIGPILYASMNL